MSEFLTRRPFIPSFQFLVYPKRMPAKIQNCKNLCEHRRFAVVDSERKSLGQQAMESKMYGVNSMKKSQTFDVGEDCIFKIGSDAYFLLVVKFTPTLDILSGFLEDNDSPHAYFEASRALSSGIVRKFPSPASTFAKRPASTSPCQSGD